MTVFFLESKVLSTKKPDPRPAKEKAQFLGFLELKIGDKTGVIWEETREFLQYIIYFLEQKFLL
jgi:hypothetical protein